MGDDLWKPSRAPTFRERLKLTWFLLKFALRNWWQFVLLIWRKQATISFMAGGGPKGVRIECGDRSRTFTIGADKDTATASCEAA